MPRYHLFKRCLISFALTLLILTPFFAYYYAWAGDAIAHDISLKSVMTVVAVGKTDKSLGYDVMLDVRRSGMTLDPTTVLASSINSEGWVVKDGHLFTNELDMPFSFACDIPSLYELAFITSYHSPLVAISLIDQTIEQDLFTTAVYKKPLFITGSSFITNSEHHLPLGVFIIAFLIVMAVIILLYAFRKRKILFLYYWITAILFLITVILLGQLTPGYGFLILFSASSMLLSPCWSRWPMVRRCKRGFPLVGIILLVLYTSFALYANPLFFERVTATITLRTVSYFWVLTIITAPLSIALVAGFDWVRRYSQKWFVTQPRTTRQVIITRLCCMATLIVPLITVATGFYPINATYDGDLYWARALGTKPMGEPFGYILLLKGLASLLPDQFLYAIMQIVLFSLAVSGILTLLYRRGLPRWMVSALALLCAFTPTNYMHMTLMSTNPMNAILLLYGMYFLLCLMEDPNRVVRQWNWLLGSGLIYLLLCYVRRNTAPGLIIFLVVICVYAWQYRGIVRKRLLAFMLVIVICATGFLIFQSAVLKNTVSSNEKTIGRLLMKPVIAAQVSGCDLPQSTLNVINDILPIYYQKDVYNPYDSDSITFSKHANWKARSVADLAGVFMDTLIRYPTAVIKDFLDQSENVWCVFQNRYNDNKRYSISSLTHTDVTKVAIAYAELFSENPVTDSILWRGGLYIILFLAYALTLLVERHGRLLLALLPTLAIACFTFPAIAFTYYQYVWFFPLVISFFLLATLFHVGEPLSTARKG